jgi:hypothetical protein
MGRSGGHQWGLQTAASGEIPMAAVSFATRNAACRMTTERVPSGGNVTGGASAAACRVAHH